MTCPNGCGDNWGADGFRRYLDILNRRSELLNVPKELIAALCLRESGGFRWFRKTDAQYKANIHEAMKITGLNEQCLLDCIVPNFGPSKGLIPKFRLEPSWLPYTKSMIIPGMVHVRADAVLPMSFGFGQKAMWSYLSGYTQEQWLKLYWEFITDPNLQLKQVAKDLAELIVETKGNVPLALTRYNGPRNAQHISEYGSAVFASYRVLLQPQSREET